MTRKRFVAQDGAWIEADGPIPTHTSGRAAVKETINGFVSRSLPKGYKYANKWKMERDPKTGKMRRGAAIIEGGRKEIREIVARANAAGENLTYDY